ncbi:unnamed protein product [Microthlaspi erraticum]|uniref:Pentacotripeptide-repeat region of PRORP domain-containing protein n=1 Tax=Microthlaspi erraticum TaxID=1685480 RepID=A0A6D2KNN4_9BRAS|nr:unnamed protein product [Microthlaspi erraticum]
MMYQWRLLLLRSCHHRPFLSKVISNSIRSLTCFHHERFGFGALQRSQCLLALPPPVTISVGRSFSTEERSYEEAVVIDVFSKLSSEDEIREELRYILISRDLVFKTLRFLESSPDVAGRFFRWVLENCPERLSSRSYNAMLRSLGLNGLVDEFWSLVDDMKKKGHYVSANVRNKVGDKFQKDGLEGDVNRLKELYASSDFSMDTKLFRKVCESVCKIVMKDDDWDAELRELKLEFNSDLVKRIVERLDEEPSKALLFFRWIDESGSFKHDEKTYNAMARVLGREKFLDRFWKLVEEATSAGYEMEMETYVRVSPRFCQPKRFKEAFELFEYAMMGSGGKNTPTEHCCFSLLKRIVTVKKPDMGLLSRAVKAYTGSNGNMVTDSMLRSVLKCLRGVDRFEKSKEVLVAMKEGGYIPSGDLERVIASGLSREEDVPVEFMDASGNPLDDEAMKDLVGRHCDAGDLEKASKCFRKMINKRGSYLPTSYALEKLILAYCDSFQARDAYNLLMELELKPWLSYYIRSSTYEIMVTNLLMKKVAADGGFEEALSLVHVMRNKGTARFVDPFIDYFSNSGTAAEAFAFLKALARKKFASNVIVVRVFEAMLKSGRHREAQDLMSLCAKHIRRKEDVLQLFSSMKPSKCSLEKPIEA